MNTPTPSPHTHTLTPLSSYFTIYRIATLAASLFLIASVPFAQQATFEGLGDLPGGNFDSNLYNDGLSGNGLVVVGQSITDGNVGEAFRWEDGEMEGLGVLPGGFISGAYSTSFDGSVVVGFVAYEKFDREAFRWEDGEMVSLGDLPGGNFFSEAYNVSADGSVIVGQAESENGSEAFRWEATADTMIGLGDLPGGNFFSIATDVSADGSVIVGQSNSTEGTEAFRWTEDGGMVGLGDLPGGPFTSVAYAVSADGSVIVGFSESENGPEAFRWEAGEMIALGALPGPFFASYALEVSADGTVVVGMSEAENQAAFIWTQEDGMRRLKEVLEEDYDLDLTGWSLGRASSISNDGTVIAGTTLLGGNPSGNTEAWRVSGLMPIADEATPEALADVLSAPTPNPVSGTSSSFTIAVERGQHVTVEVFDVMGRHVEKVYEGALAAGMSESLTLNASALPAGVYMIRATGEDFTRTRRVTVVK